MPRQVVRRSRRRVLGEIGRRSDNGAAHVGRDTDGDHVLFDDAAEANAGVETARHDVGQVIIGDDLDPHLRVRGQEGRKDRHENGHDSVLALGSRPFSCLLTGDGQARAPFVLDPIEARPIG